MIVGGVLGIIAIILAVMGKNRHKLASPAPTRTAKDVQRDAHTAKEVTTYDR